MHVKTYNYHQLLVIHFLLNLYSERSRHPRALVITPTRELCNQVTKSVQDLSYHVRCVSIYGGDSYARQVRTYNSKYPFQNTIDPYLSRHHWGLNICKYLSNCMSFSVMNAPYGEVYFVSVLLVLYPPIGGY